jgi:hypothetical protein
MDYLVGFILGLFIGILIGGVFMSLLLEDEENPPF